MWETNRQVLQRIPNIIFDDILYDPHSLIEYSKTLEYFTDKNFNWPGVRSKSLHEINPKLFRELMLLFLSKIYDLNYFKVYFSASLNFQKISNMSFDQNNYLTEENLGWVHRDDSAGSLYSGIVYLNEDYWNYGGTCLYNRKKKLNLMVEDSVDIKKQLFSNDPNLNIEYLRKFKKEFSDNFESKLVVPNMFNRLFLFDSSQFHSHDFYSKTDKERLTLIFFIHSISIEYSTKI